MVGLVAACVFCGYSGNVCADYIPKFEGKSVIDWAGYRFLCKESTDATVIVGGPGIDGLDVYSCTKKGWSFSNDYGKCNWGGSYTDSGEVPYNTWGHVEESLYAKESSMASGDYGWVTHHSIQRSEPFAQKLSHETRMGGMYCSFRGCADYAEYIKNGPRCKRKYPLYLYDGKYHFCVNNVKERNVWCGTLAEKDECPCPEPYTLDKDSEYYGDGDKYTLDRGGKEITWECRVTPAGPYWKPVDKYAIDKAVDLLEQYQCSSGWERTEETSSAITQQEDETLRGETSAPVDAGQEQETTAPAASSGDCNTQEEKEKLGAVEIKKQGALCVATECKPDHYKVKDASGVYRGWCIPITCSPGQHVNIDPDAMFLENDTKCVADTPTNTETQVETPGDTNAGTSAATETGETTSATAPGQETPAPTWPADGTDCKDIMYMADIATYQNGVCTVHECYAGFEAKENQCVEISGPCKSLPDNATSGHREYDEETESEKCIITDCVDGYVVADDKMSCREDYDALAEQAREREQSTGNKLLGALGMGATGIGGSMLMSGLAESAADDDAERAMTAYLETFTCKYGNESVSGGTMNVEIPGGNELINMYSEYVALANDLKLRKAALGMKPGIESEPILDSATSGLYDDVGTGRGKGVYASLARALENPDGEDAKAWAAQREESEKKKKTGAIVAGIGAVGSLIGNLAINADWDKNKHKALRDLEEDVNNIQPSRTTPCPDDADGTSAPNCDCSRKNKAYDINLNLCYDCSDGRVVLNNKCECPQANQIYMSGSGQCVDMGDAMAHANKIVADTLSHLQTAMLSADAMFEYGKSELRPDAEEALDGFINELRNEKSSDCEVNVFGYADPSGSPDPNLKLSEKRASAVAKYLRDNGSDVIKSVESKGMGEENCTCGLRSNIKDSDTSEDGYVFCKDQPDGTPVPDTMRYAPCRRVEIQMQNCELESDVAAALGQGAGEIAGSALDTLTTVLTGQ